MNKLVFFLAVLGSATGLLAACNGDPAARRPATSESGAATGIKPSQKADHAPGTTAMLAALNNLSRDLEAVKPTGNADYDFTRLMLAHHQGAGALSALELRYGQDAGLRALARQVSADQEKEIAALKAIAARLAGAAASQAESPDPFASLMKSSRERLINLGGTGGVDADYARLMVAHHQSAIDLAKAELAYGRDARLQAKAQQLIDARQNELQQFERWPAPGAKQPMAGLAE